MRVFNAHLPRFPEEVVMSLYTPGIKSMANKNSLVSIPDTDPVMQMIQAFGGADNKFSKELKKGIKKHQDKVRSGLSKNPEWASIANNLHVGLSPSGDSLSYTIKGDQEVQSKYMTLEYGDQNTPASGRIRSLANSGNAISDIINDALKAVLK
jgi:hypothetical protein